MQYDEFIGAVQNRARLATQGEAARAAEATLQTLAERLAGEESEHLVAQLPEELARRIQDESPGEDESFSYDEFMARVAKREGVELSEATYHARAVIDVWREAVSPGQVDHVLTHLSDDYRPLFESQQETS